MEIDSKALAVKIKIKVLEMVHKANASHIGGALSMTDLLAVLYSSILKFDPANPADPLRDRFILSKGHASPALYAVWYLLGVVTDKDLSSYRTFDSVLEGHPTPDQHG